MRSTEPHWIETHGRAQVRQIAGGATGLFAIGTDGLVYSFPEFGGLWHQWNGQLRPLVIAGIKQGVVYATADGRVGRRSRGSSSAPKWKLPKAAVALSGNESGTELYAVSEGQVWNLSPKGAVLGPCPEVVALSIAFRGGHLWVTDGERLYKGSQAGCPPVLNAPGKIVRLSGMDKRLFGVTASGDVFRLEEGKPWEKLPRPKKFRPDRFPKLHKVRDVAVTSTAAWAVDDEGHVFVLSESQ